MTNVLDFHIELIGFENKIWRDIQISDNATIATLGYAVLASYQAAACHLFNVKYKGKRYEFVFDADDFSDMLGPAINPAKVKLKDFRLHEGDTFSMEYDYGAGWEWTIEYKGSAPMKTGAGTHYPWISAAEGKGIVEDTSPYELAAMMEKIDNTNEPIPIPDYGNFDRMVNWDYRWCDLKVLNCLFKGEIEDIRGAYEGYPDM